jgi:trehalose 6-phosphate synthase
LTPLIVVSNRGPVTVTRDAGGHFSVGHAAGGLAPSLLQALHGSGAIWIAAAMTEDERQAATAEEELGQVHGIEVALLDLDETIVASAYSEIANDVLWFLYHDLFNRPIRPVFDRAFYLAWARYRSYNESFAQAIAERADDGATVIVNDYHLSLVGSALRGLRPDLKTVHFTHTPFCTPSELSVLPRAIATELVEGLAGFGACGFHTARWAAAYKGCCEAYGVRPPVVFDSPLGSDAEEIRGQITDDEVIQHVDALRDHLGDRRLIFRSDRLELSKNLVRGFLAFEELLDTAPRWRGRVVFLARTYPSRTELSEYREYRTEVEEVVARINARFSDATYVPIELVIEDDFAASLAGFTAYDVLLVNPLRDGMNLVAKEGPIANQRDGVVVLSTEAGAFVELADCALAVQPYDVSGTASQLLRALDMAASERAGRAQRLKIAASALPPRSWLETVVEQAVSPHRFV